MTVVLQRDLADGPRLHALVIGCGRFPYLPGAPNSDRQACYDSAVAVIEFLAERADDLEPPLARVDCLLSDPRVPAGGQDMLLPSPEGTQAGLVEMAVAPVREAEVRRAFEELLEAFRPGDTVFIYACSHGVAGRDETGLLVLEDVNSSLGSPWAQLLDVKSVALHLPARSGAANVWIFMDACQEILEELRDQAGGVRGIAPVTTTSSAMVTCPVRSTALAAARYGQQTFAPAAGGVAYFTQALLDALGQSCVEWRDREWRVTAKELNYGLDSIARAAGIPAIEVTALTSHNKQAHLLRVANPSVPVLITSRPAATLATARSAHLLDDAGNQLFGKGNGPEWRFRAPPQPASYRWRVEGITPPPLHGEIEIRPPAVELEIP